MKSNHARAQAILLPSDLVTEDESCLVIQMRPHRRELVQTYLKQLNPNVAISFSSAEIRREPCKLKVEKIRETDSTKISGAANQNGSSVLGENTKSQSIETMQITTLNDFELLVNLESIKGTCRYVKATRYEISIEVRKDARPLLPPVPPGTVVILKTNQLPPPQETSKLQTTIQLNEGDRIEIGTLIQDLKKKNSEVSIEPSASGSVIDGANTEKVFLSLQ